MTVKLLSKVGTIAGLGFAAAVIAGTAASAATITVTPSSGLADGQSVSVSGSGMLASDTYHIGECAAVSATSYACGPNVDVKSDASGKLSTKLAVKRTFVGAAADGSTSQIDCKSVQCVIGVFDDSFNGGAVPISFK
ncbi:MAG TPA: enediyne antibiotic chromoprotein [Streptosporangiaceae bacterium]